MKDTLRIGLLTLAVFAAGLLTGIWTQHLRPMPPPPMPPLGEMDGFRPHGQHDKKHFPSPPDKTAEMEKGMAELRPQMEAFAQKLKNIETTFRQNFGATLTPEQKKIVDAMPAPPSVPPLGGPGFPERMIGPLEGMAFFTIIQPPLEHFTKELSLTADQQSKLKALLIERRSQFFELVDTTPPPSLELRHMAPR